MPRRQNQYALEDGTRVTIPELVQSKHNTWPVSYQCIYERMRKGERALEQLLRPPMLRIADRRRAA